MHQKDYLSSKELADLLKVSRIAIHKKIRSGQIRAKKIGRNYVIATKDVGDIITGKFTDRMKYEIETAVAKVIKEYGETLKLLGKE